MNNWAKRQLGKPASSRLSPDIGEARRFHMSTTRFNQAARLLWGRDYNDELVARHENKRRMLQKIGLPYFGSVGKGPRHQMNTELQEVLIAPSCIDYCVNVLTGIL